MALVVTSPPYFAGKEYEEALGEGHIPASYLDYLDMLTDGLRRVRAHARARGSDRRERGQPGTQALPVAVGRRHRHPPGPPGAAAAGRGHLAQGARRQRVVRVGLVPEPGQPGPARPHRAGGHRQQGPLRPGAVASRPPGARPAVGDLADQGGVHRGHHRRVGDRPASAPPGSATPPRSPSSCPCASSSSTPTRATSSSTRSSGRAPPPSPPCAAAATSSATTPSRSTSASPSSG